MGVPYEPTVKQLAAALTAYDMATADAWPNVPDIRQRRDGIKAALIAAFNLGANDDVQRPSDQ